MKDLRPTPKENQKFCNDFISAPNRSGKPMRFKQEFQCELVDDKKLTSIEFRLLERLLKQEIRDCSKDSRDNYTKLVAISTLQRLKEIQS